jgi:hypothetical protein
LGPFALIFALFVSDLKKEAAAAAEAEATKSCPYCAERIKGEAVVCRYCGRDLPSKKETDQAAPEVS